MINTLFNKAKRKIGSRPIFRTRDVKLGKNVKFGKNVVFNSKKVVIGDGTVFHDNITINSDVFIIGDYCTIYSYCFFPGPGTLKIGHNFWLGYSSIIDCQGSTEINNNVGVGPQSQLWTHMKFGDIMVGCRFHSTKRLLIEDDAWLVGHCLVSPVHIGKSSLAMLGSLVTEDMVENHVYAGVPAKDITDKVGKQFVDTSIEERERILADKIYEFSKKHNISEIWKMLDIVSGIDESHKDSDKIILDIKNRTYVKKNTAVEMRLIKYLLPDIKFIPAPKS